MHDLAEIINYVKIDPNYSFVISLFVNSGCAGLAITRSLIHWIKSQPWLSHCPRTPTQHAIPPACELMSNRECWGVNGHTS